MIWNERESSQLQETVSLLKDVNDSVQSSLKSRPKQLTIQKYLFTFLKDFLSLRESLNKTIFEFLKSEISQSNIRDTWFEYESGWDLRDYSMCRTGEYLKENPPPPFIWSPPLNRWRFLCHCLMHPKHKTKNWDLAILYDLYYVQGVPINMGIL